MSNNKGFTLLEILIALFIFSILAMIIMNALQTVLNAQASSEKHATRLAELQIALTLLERDLDQSILRSITNTAGATEASFMGSHESFTFTHGGYFNPQDKVLKSSLQRTRYQFEKNSLVKETWDALDMTHDTKSFKKRILVKILQGNFEYLDSENKFQNRWPAAQPASNDGEFPRAVRVTITLEDLGKMSQLYVIPIQKITKPT